MAIDTPVKWTGGVGATATLANTGFQEVYFPGGSMTFTDTWKPRNTQVVIDANGTSTAGYVLGVSDIAATDVMAFDQPLKPVTLPASEATLVFFGNGETRQVSVNVEPNGVIQVRGRTSPDSVIWRSAAGALAANVPVVVSVYFTRSDTAGTVRVVVYNEDGTTVRADSGLLTGRNTGTLAITRIKHTIAKSSSSSTIVARHLFGEPRWDRVATGILPAWTQRNPFRTVVNGVWKSVKLYTVVNGAWVALH